MNKLPDRAKMRREYLWKKRLGSTLAVIGICVYACFSFYALITISDLFLSTPARTWPDRIRLLQTVSMLIPLSAIALLAYKVSRASVNKVKSLPHIPPLREQLASLPTGEVLLRGSQASPASSEELLRPAGSEQTLAEELLRGAGNGGS